MRVIWLRPVALARESWPLAVAGGAGLLLGFALALRLAGGARDRLIEEQSATIRDQARVLAMQDAAIRAAGPILAACPPEHIVTRRRTAWEVGTRRAPSTGATSAQAGDDRGARVRESTGAPLARPSRRDLPGFVRAYVASLLLAGSGIVVYLVRMLEAS